jgi:fructose-bisphosphate aldolase class 1
MSAQELIATAKAMVSEGKGLLAMDESTPTCNKRFEKVGNDCPHRQLGVIFACQPDAV